MNSDLLLQPAFIAPGGLEFLLVMLVLLMMFGAKDAPRILRKLNEIFNQIRNTADHFKREVMYGDLGTDIHSESAEFDDGYDFDAEFEVKDPVEENESVQESGETKADASDNEGDGDVSKA